MLIHVTTQIDQIRDYLPQYPDDYSVLRTYATLSDYAGTSCGQILRGRRITGIFVKIKTLLTDSCGGFCHGFPTATVKRQMPTLDGIGKIPL